MRGEAEPATSRSIPRVRALRLAWALLLVGLVAVILYAVPSVQMAHPRAVMASAFIPYGIVAWLGAAVMFLIAGQRWFKLMGVLALAGFAIQAQWAQPYWPRESTPSDPDFTVLSLNLRCNPVGLDELAETIETIEPDLVVLQGVGGGAWNRLQEADWPQNYRERTFHPMPHLATCGSRVFSRAPLMALTEPTVPQPVLRAALDSGPVLILPVDIPTPDDGLGPWSEAYTTLGDAVAEHVGEPMLLAGDFNAVREHVPMRRLMDQAGLRDAAEASGVGWLPTFPANRAFPPLIALDHVLVSRDLGVADVETVRIGENAHVAVIAHLEG